MAITNRDKDASEQRIQLGCDLGAYAATVGASVGVAYSRNIFAAPFPCTVEQVKVAASGISGSPSWQLEIDRFIVGTGLTTLTGASWVAGALAVQEIGTSGLQSVSILSSLNLEKGDILKVTTSVLDAAVADGSISLVVKSLQDIKTYFGTAVS